MPDVTTITYPLDQEVRILLTAEARRAGNWNGSSEIHGRHDRMTPSLLDQKNFIGFAGEWALCVYLTGSADRFWAGRRERRRRPWEGDGGTDLPPWRVDAKTSLMRTSQVVESYHLLVRESMLRPSTAYVAAFVGRDLTAVTLAGWAVTDELQRAFRADAPGSPFAIRVPNLHPMITLPRHLDEQQAQGLTAGA